MNQNSNECAEPAACAELADRIIRELLIIARQWVVLRFLMDEEGRQGGLAQWGHVNGQPPVRLAALHDVVNELIAQGLVEWVQEPDGAHPRQIRLSSLGRQFVHRMLDRSHPGAIQQTLDSCRCTDPHQLVEILEKAFHRLEQ